MFSLTLLEYDAKVKNFSETTKRNIKFFAKKNLVNFSVL